MVLVQNTSPDSYIWVQIWKDVKDLKKCEF